MSNSLHNTKSEDRPGRSFRLSCEPGEIPLVEELLRTQGFEFEEEPFSPVCRRATRQPIPLGSSLAAYFGLIYILDRSSMLPPLALDPAPGASVLDMCASPGSKTGLLAGLVGETGFVLANEPAPDRLTTLRRNLIRENRAQAATCGHLGQQLPLPDATFPYILCDAPCSGWGTAAKNPKALAVWREDKVGPLIGLQRALLTEAARLLAPGGRLVYSTCTTNVAENEEQTRFVLDTTDLGLTSLAPVPGFTFKDPADPGLAGVLRVDGEASQAQGFYIAAFSKPGGPVAPGTDREPGRSDDAPGAKPGLPGTTGTSLNGLLGETTEKAAQHPETTKHDLGMDVSVPPGLDLSRLPPGYTQQFDRRLFFLPKRARDFESPQLKLRGFHLGTLADGVFRPQARARLLLREFDPASGLDARDPQTLAKLIAGQSLESALDLPRPGLYFRGLRLGLLTRKGPRLLWSDR